MNETEETRVLIEAMQQLKAADAVVTPPLARVLARAELAALERQMTFASRLRVAAVAVVVVGIGTIVALAPGAEVFSRMASVLPLIGVGGAILALTLSEDVGLAY